MSNLYLAAILGILLAVAKAIPDRCSCPFDQQPPQFDVLPVNQAVCAGQQLPPAPPSASDNCSPVTLTSMTSFFPSRKASVRTETVVWTATDACLNRATATQIRSFCRCGSAFAYCPNNATNQDCAGVSCNGVRGRDCLFPSPTSTVSGSFEVLAPVSGAVPPTLRQLLLGPSGNRCKPVTIAADVTTGISSGFVFTGSIPVPINVCPTPGTTLTSLSVEVGCVPVNSTDTRKYGWRIDLTTAAGIVAGGLQIYSVGGVQQSTNGVSSVQSPFDPNLRACYLFVGNPPTAVAYVNNMPIRGGCPTTTTKLFVAVNAFSRSCLVPK